MTRDELKAMADQELVDMLTSLSPRKDGKDAVAWLASVIATEGWVEGAHELRRRYLHTAQERSKAFSAPLTQAGRRISPRAVFVSADRFYQFFFQRRIPLNQVGPLFGRATSWASVIMRRGRMGYVAVDDLASALDIHVDDFVWQVASDEERQRCESV